MIERFINWIGGVIFMWLFGLLAIGCTGCTFRVEVVTLPDPATRQWMEQTNDFNGAVKKEVDDHEQRLKKMEDNTNGCTIAKCANFTCTTH